MSIDRLPEETDKQYLAYTCYRDLGLSRSMVAAQRVYDQKTGKKVGNGAKRQTNGSFDGWSKANCWEERVRAWDLEKETSIAEALRLAEDTEYIQAIETYRSSILTGGMTVIKSSLESVTAIEQILNGIIKVAENNGWKMSSGEHKRFADCAKMNADCVKATLEASDLVERALSINLLMEKLNTDEKMARKDATSHL